MKWCLALLLLVPQAVLGGEPPRVYSPGQRPDDQRLDALKDLNGYFPFQPPTSPAAWQERAQHVRRRILVSTGLWPMPERPEIRPTIHGRIDREDYAVEKVYFESYPGFYVTGNLYRPQGRKGPFPAVLSPHGHFSEGRFHDQGIEATRHKIFVGAERFEEGGRHPLQARCVQLARMGCIVFHYDMVGYADSKQISYELAHRHSTPRPELESPRAWGFFTAQAEMRLQNIMGLQTFNSLRAVDFVVGLPDVDPHRLAVTGASGGGTQAMILSAIDPRIAVSFPAVMVSTAMQGGCTCENAVCLRVGTGNVEFAALFAPKPQGLNAADDWTVELASKGLPELQQLYEMLGAPDNVAGYHLTHFPHNYNAVSRGKMYHWLNRHLQLGWAEPILERNYRPLSISEMSVWTGDHPAPEGGTSFETKFLQQLADASDRQLKTMAETSPQRHRELVRNAMATILATNWEATPQVKRQNVTKIDQGSYWLFKDKLRTATTELPLIFLHPKQWNGEVLVWATGRGKAGCFRDTGEPTARLQELLADGYSIAAADLFQQGEFRASADVLKTTRKVENERDFAGYTFGYNRTLLGNQVHDLLTIVKFVADDDHGAERIRLVGVDGAAPQAVLAAVFAGSEVDALSIDDPDFRFVKVKSWRDPYFLPGAIKYGDLPAMLDLCKAPLIALP